jgi:hypothetical protein
MSTEPGLRFSRFQIPCLPHTIAPKADDKKALINNDDDDDEPIAHMPIYPSKHHHHDRSSLDSSHKKMSFIN